MFYSKFDSSDRWVHVLLVLPRLLTQSKYLFFQIKFALFYNFKKAEWPEPTDRTISSLEASDLSSPRVHLCTSVETETQTGVHVYITST